MESLRRNKTTIALLLTLVLILTLASWYTYTRVTEVKRLESDAGKMIGIPPTDAPVRYIGQNGTAVALHELVGGSVLYINTWASWSPLSKDELIALNEVAGEFSGQNVTFIALNRKETREQAERFLATLPPLPHLQIIIDTEDHFYHAAAGYAMPETMIFDQTGALIVHERQPQTADAMRAFVSAALGSN